MEKHEIDVESMLAVLKEEEPLAKCSAYTYTRVVQEHFEKILSYCQVWCMRKVHAAFLGD